MRSLAVALVLFASSASAFVPPKQGGLAEDPMITVAPVSGPIPAPRSVAAPPADAEVSPSGLRSKLLRPGTGPQPKDGDTVTAHYTGWTTDGKMFDSSVTRKAPFKASLKSVIPGFAEGLQKMRVGEQRRLWIPGKLGYGDAPKPGRPTGMLVFDVELLSIP